MTKHNFTPEQSENILNALADLLDCENAYQKAKSITEMSRKIITSSIEETPSGDLEMTLTGNYIDKLLANTENLTDFFFSVGDVLSSKN